MNRAGSAMPSWTHRSAGSRSSGGLLDCSDLRGGPASMHVFPRRLQPVIRFRRYRIGVKGDELSRMPGHIVVCRVQIAAIRIAPNFLRKERDDWRVDVG